jgi:lipoprotein NlpD
MEQTVPLGGASMTKPPVSNLKNLALSASLTLLLAACSTTHRPAPVVDRSPAGANGTASATAAPWHGAENAGKPGYYTVKRGDTLIRIGLENGQSWRDIQNWNGLTNPNVIEVGQVLRVVPPENAANAAAKPVPTPALAPVQGRPLEPRPASATPTPAAQPASVPPAAEEVRFAWPVKGELLEGFDEARNKGLDLGGRLGDPVLAAADGRVVYAGAGLRGYGNLIILKHNNTYLTAYAHNQALLVKEDQTVRQGQKIAEMGSTDADRVKLHFEVRRNGKPVDPAKQLPAR